MTTQELSKAINNKQTVIYNGSEYLPVGFEFLFLNGRKIYSALLADSASGRCVFTVKMNEIELKED